MPSEKIVTPFQSLGVGDFISFTLFPDVPPETVKKRDGVIVSLDIQIADLESGDMTVQTLLGLVSRDAYDAGKKEPEEQVPLEALKTLKVDASRRKVASWQPLFPALNPQEPPRFEKVSEDGTSKPISLADLRKSMAGKSGKKKNSKSLNSDKPTPYISSR